MTSITFPRSFRDHSNRLLRGPVPTHFEAFYRAKLRYRSGQRVRSLDVARLYAGWANDTGAPGMNLREIRRAMLSVGHRHFRSNITYYGDVQLASEALELPDNFPEGPPIAEPDRGILGRIDRIGVELEQLRRTVLAGQA